jgi:hypothetical protein
MGLLIVEGIWLLLLGVAHLVLRREFGILAARARLAGRSATDGLEVGSPLPRSWSELDGVVVLFLFDNCEPCISVAAELASSTESYRRLRIVVVPPPVSPASQQIGAELDGLIADILQPKFDFDSAERARTIAETFKVRSGPFAMVAAGGLVVAKSQVAGLATIDEMTEISERRGVHRLESTT